MSTKGDILPSIRSFYEGRMAGSEESARQVGWRDAEAQQIRFVQLARILPASDFSLNDYGCGMGDLYGFLTRHHAGFTYHGYDALPKMIDHAHAQWGGASDHLFSVASTPAAMDASDYTLVSGTFNVKQEVSSADWQSEVEDALREIDAKSRKGFAFNMLTSYSDAPLMRPELYYANPLHFFDFCKRNFAKNVALLHDYGIYDFTVLVRKDMP